jgi:hypothetical protein
VKRTQVIDHFLDAWAGADDEDSHGFGDRGTGLTDRVSNVHNGVLFFSLSGGGQKAKKLSGPTVELQVGWLMKLRDNLAERARWSLQRIGQPLVSG